MITDWDQLKGKTIAGTYLGSGGVVLLLGDEFAVVTAEMDYGNESAHSTLATLDDEDALTTASAAGASGAYPLLENAQYRRHREIRELEQRRLEYLQEKYG